MNVWRIHLKPESDSDITYEDILKFCMDEQIIGVGWKEITCITDNWNTLRSEVYNSSYDKKPAAFKAINAMRKMQPGDLIWTRLGQDASEYYLCRVGEKLWVDRIITPRHIDYGICQFVSATWIKIGKENHVPGKVLNSFIPSATVQRVKDVTEVSKFIWNKYCTGTSPRYTDLSTKDFWDAIGSEDLECLVLLYLQFLGNYIYSSTLKQGTAKFETAMISKDGKNKIYPQVKRVTPLYADQYTTSLEANEKAILFTTSQNYGEKQFDNVICLTKAELETFIRDHEILLPDSIRYWLELTDFK